MRVAIEVRAEENLISLDVQQQPQGGTQLLCALPSPASAPHAAQACLRHQACQPELPVKAQPAAKRQRQALRARPPHGRGLGARRQGVAHALPIRLDPLHHGLVPQPPDAQHLLPPEQRRLQRGTRQELHAEDSAPGELRDDLRHGDAAGELRRGRERLPQSLEVPRLLLVVELLLELLPGLLQADLLVGPTEQPHERLEAVKVGAKVGGRVRVLHLDDHVPPPPARQVGLTKARRPQRFPVDALEEAVHGGAEVRLDDPPYQLPVRRRDGVCQGGQLALPGVRQQGGHHAHDLQDLHVHAAELL
mmetsp:Transcript_96873/g.289358  ORF Transcript_96873/g.289358 Transcript_96873/m.289358 type:complete len:305 (+) Transcript_96873:500-1414(+)